MSAVSVGPGMFRVDELVSVVHGRLLAGDPQAMIGAVSTDTRRLEPGALFWALHGERFDGAAFVESALAQGACGAVVAESAIPRAVAHARPGAALIAVRDPLRALQDAASAYRSRWTIPLIGVTGSNGKTTTKEMAASVLSHLGPTLKTLGNFNNHIGVPLTLFRLDPAHRSAVIEFGINHPGEMTRLCEIARPTVGLITNIGQAHLEGLGGVEGVARAKGELFQSLPLDGLALVNADDPRLIALQRHVRCASITFGLTAADVQGVVKEEGTREGLRLEIRSGTDRAEAFIPVVGRHNASNAVAAAAIGVAVGLDMTAIAAGLAAFRPSSMRSEFVTTPSGVVIFNDAYNANPSSMERALDTIARLRGAGRVYAVLGEMFELGERAEVLHRGVGQMAARAKLDGLVTVGAGGRWVANEAVRSGMPRHTVVAVETADEAVPVIAAWSRRDDMVLIKGSRRVGLERVAVGLGLGPLGGHG